MSFNLKLPSMIFQNPLDLLIQPMMNSCSKIVKFRLIWISIKNRLLGMSK